MRTLIVDDDPVGCTILTKCLEDVAEIAVSHSGREAVAAVNEALGQNRPFQLIFMDIVMPGLDGHETLERIREAEKNAGLAPEQRAKALMTTSMDDEDNTMAALFEGRVSAYLVKPVNKQELLKKLRSLELIS